MPAAVCLFLIFLKIITIIAAEFDNNDTQITYLNIGEIVFFETPNYPALMNYSDFQICCNMTFYLQNATKLKNYRLLVANAIVSNVEIHGLDYDVSFSILNQNLYTFEFDYLYYSIAQQGFVLFEDSTNGCPGESLSKENPFAFKDETKILYIQSSYDIFQKRNKSCSWRFSAPDGYGFKIVITVFNVSSQTEFIVKNTTDILINNRNAKILFPYYNSDDFIQISLSTDNSELNTSFEFQAYISVVRKDLKKIEGNCNITETDNSIVWSNWDNYNGYSNDEYCTYDLIIQSDINYQVTQELLFEKHIDYIAYYEDGFENRLTNDLTSPTFVFLLSNNNGTEKKVRFEFYSDGSIPSLGFTVTFMKQICECQNMNIICGKFFSITNNGIYFCGALNCSIIIEPCPSKYGLISFLAVYDGKGYNVDDHFKIISNGLTVFSYAPYIQEITKDFFIYVNSENENILEINTVSFPMARSLTLFLNPFEGATGDLSVILTADKPRYIIDTGLYTLSTVETFVQSNNNVFFVWESTSDVYFYNNENLTIVIDSNNCTRACELKVRKFAIYVPEQQTLYPIIAVQAAEHQNGCVFKKTIYTINNPIKITALATKNNSCTITLLFTNFYYISHLWANSEKDDIKLYIGTDKTHLYYKFNSKTATNLTEIGLFSKSYLLEIPKNGAVFISIEQNILQYIDITQKSYKSIIATPDYRFSKMNYHFNGNFLVYNILNEMALKFTVLYYKMDGGDEFYFTNYNGTKFNITDKSTPQIFTGNNVSIYCVHRRSKNINTGAMFFVESVPSELPRLH